MTGSSPRKARKNAAETRPDYEVGYGKPPRAHRFRPGKSGNPKGRPRRNENVPGLVRRLMREKIKVRVGEKLKTMTTLEVMLRRQIEKVVKGDTRAFNALMAMLAENTPDLLAEIQDRALASDDLAVLASFIRRRTARGKI